MYIGMLSNNLYLCAYYIFDLIVKMSPAHICGPAVVRHMYGQTCVSRAIKTVYAGDEILSI